MPRRNRYQENIFVCKFISKHNVPIENIHIRNNH